MVTTHEALEAIERDYGTRNTTVDEIWQLIVVERQRQIIKWGKQAHADGRWLLILIKELGKASKSLLEGDHLSGAEELVQAAAVIVAWLEDMLEPEYQEYLRTVRDERREMTDSEMIDEMAERIAELERRVASPAVEAIPNLGVASVKQRERIEKLEAVLQQWLALGDEPVAIPLFGFDHWGKATADYDPDAK